MLKPSILVSIHIDNKEAKYLNWLMRQIGPQSVLTVLQQNSAAFHGHLSNVMASPSSFP
jgi:hypothetical protein